MKKTGSLLVQVMASCLFGTKNITWNAAILILIVNCPLEININFEQNQINFWKHAFETVVSTVLSILHYNDVIMGMMASKITSLTILYSIVYSRCRSKKTSKLRVTGLCEGTSPVTGEFPAQRASNVENVSIWWHHDVCRGTELLSCTL